MKVTTSITVYEENGAEAEALDTEPLTVESHWSRNGFNGLVVLKRGEVNLTVSAEELEEAVKRCVDLR